MTYSRAVMAIVVLVGCGTDPASDGPDAGASPATTDVTCFPYTRIATYGDGHYVSTTLRIGTVDIAPDADYSVELCGLMQTPPPELCPPGAACTGSAGPDGARCERTYRSGTFLDGKLRVSCGQTVESYAANGQMTSRTEYRFGIARVTVY